MKTILTLAALLLQSAPFAESESQQPAPAQGEVRPLTETHLQDLECAAAFAIIATEQKRGAAGSDAYPPLGDRGREYFVKVGQRVIDETGMTKEAVRDELFQIVKTFQAESAQSDDPIGLVDSIVTPCLAKLNSEIPPAPEPSLPECAAILSIAYDEVHAREGLSPTAKDLNTLATVLNSRARDMLKADGLTQIEIDRVMVTTKEDFLGETETGEGAGTSPNINYEHCFELAAP